MFLVWDVNMDDDSVDDIVDGMIVHWWLLGCLTPLCELRGG